MGKTKVTKSTMLIDALKGNKNAAKTFKALSMGCASCSAAPFETIEWGANMHGVDPDKLVEQING